MNTEQLTTLERKIERFSNILDQRPGDGLTVLALAEASFRRGLKLEALTAYQEVTKEKPVPEAHLAVAEIYSQQNMINEAYGELSKLFEIDPENVEARLLAHILTEEADPPEEIAGILNEPTSDEAFDEAQLRLQIQLTIHNRDLQERTRNVTLEPGVVIHEYYVEEAKKKLIEVQEMLRKTHELRRYNEELRLAPRPEPVSAQETPEEVVAPLSTPHTEVEAHEISQLDPVATGEGAEPSFPVEVSGEQAAAPEMVVPGAESVDVRLAAAAEAPSLEIPTPEQPMPVDSSTVAVAGWRDDAVSSPLSAAPVAPSEPAIPSQEEAVEPVVPSAFETVPPSEPSAPTQPAATMEPVAPSEQTASIAPDASFESEAPIEPPSLNEPVLQLEHPPAQAPMGPDAAMSPVEVDSAPIPEPMPLSAEPQTADDYPQAGIQTEESHQLELQTPPVYAAPEESVLEPAAQPVSDSYPEPAPVIEPTFPEPSLEPELPEESVSEVQPQIEDSVSAGLELETPGSLEPVLPDEISPGGVSPEPQYAPEVSPEPPRQEDYTMSIDIGVDSVVSPDLPDEPMPIEPVSIAPSAEEEAVQPAPVLPDSMHQESPEVVPEPVTSDFPQESAPIEELAAAPVSASTASDMAARQAYYESKAEELGKLTGTLARTRGVTSIFLVSREGMTIDSVVKDDVTEERIGELVKESFEFLTAYAKNPAYWVLECTGGIFVMQALDDRHVLIAVGQAGANFGALRYTMDKTKAKFATILDNVPA